MNTKSLMFFTLGGMIAVTALANDRVCAADQCQSHSEPGFTRLFDGKTLSGWLTRKDMKEPTKGWVVKDNVLTILPKNAGGGVGDIITAKKYSDFILKFDFRLTAKANSGVKYLFDPKRFGGTTMEYQVLDPQHPDAVKGIEGNRKTASLYDLMPANAEPLLKPLGEWNQGMLVVKGMHVEHWLNGKKVLEFERDSEKFKKAVASSKFNKHPGWGTQTEGHILLQDHNDQVSFRNIMIKELK